uniref:Uncharacterized protein n=1 Tax=Hucho hucho TaxID=62062 RepID=A0A4W5L5V7_9TELE
MLDLVDIFGPSEAPPPADDLWNAQPAVTSDPWDSVAVHSNTPVIGSPWATRPSSSSPTNPWAPSRSPTWEAPPTSSSSPVKHGWESPPPLTGDGTDRTDPFSVREEEEFKGVEGPPQPGSPTGNTHTHTHLFVFLYVYVVFVLHVFLHVYVVFILHVFLYVYVVFILHVFLYVYVVFVLHVFLYVYVVFILHVFLY